MGLKKLAEYYVWANDIARKMLEEVSEEELSRNVVPPFGSIRNLCTHIMLAIEYNIEKRARGKDVDPYELGKALHGTPKDGLLAKWREIDEKLLEYAIVETDEEATFPNFLGEGEIRVNHDDFVLQYILHTVYHRAQIMSAMRALGREGKTTDYLYYLSYLSN